MRNTIILTKGTQREYLSVGTDGDKIENAYQSVDLSNNTSVLEFDLSKDSQKWAMFDGEGLEIEALGRIYCIFGEDSITKSRDGNGLFLYVNLKETWYKLAKTRITTYNINVATSPEIDHIDRHMVMLLGNSPDPLFINGIRVTNPFPVGTARYFFWILLYDTGWSLDARYDSFWPDGRHDLETDKQSVLDNIRMLQSLFGGMLLWDSKNRRVALVDENKYRAYEGFKVRYRHNLASIEKKEDRNIITRLNVYGNSNLNIAALNGGRDFLDNFSYTNEVLEDIITNNDIYTQQSLLDWGRRQSVFYCRPRYTYTVDIYRYRHQEDKAIPQPVLGNLGEVMDDDITITPVRQRILAIKQNVFIDHDCTVTIGDIIRTFEGKFVDTVENSDKAGDAITEAGKVPGAIIKGKTPALEKAEKEINDTIVNTASEIRIELKDVEKGLETLVSITAGQIRTEVRDTENRLNTSITQTAAAIRLEANAMESRLNSSITVTASSIRSEVNDVDRRLSSSISQVAGRVDIVVTSGGQVRASIIVDAINSSSVTINAARVNLQGYVTISSLGSGGSTNIDGARITTGTISANRIDVGSITTSVINSGRVVAQGGSFSGDLTANVTRCNAIQGVIYARGGSSSTMFWNGSPVRLRGVQSSGSGTHQALCTT